MNTDAKIYREELAAVRDQIRQARAGLTESDALLDRARLVTSGHNMNTSK